MSPKTFTILGGDKRQNYLLSILRSHGYNCYDATSATISCPQLAHMLNHSEMILGAIPFCPNGRLKGTAITTNDFQTLLHKGQHLFAGAISSDFLSSLTPGKIICHDYMKDEEIAIFNSIATAEGLICDIIASFPGNLYKCNVLVLGYGRCARTLADRLKGLGCNITVCARSETALALAYSLGHNTLLLDELANNAVNFPVIINTIPAPVITAEILAALTSENHVYDIASLPGGVDFKAADRLGIPATSHLSLPGKYSPKTSAEALFQFIIKKQKAYFESE